VRADPFIEEKKNMKRATKGLFAVLLCGAVAGGAPALAQPPQGMPGPGGHPHMMMHERLGQGMGSDERGQYGGSWRATLSSEQRSEIAMSHLRMQQKYALAEARIALQEAEIATVIASDDGDDAGLQAGVEELVSLKKELLLSKYHHLMEVRQLLTPQQRISFDLWVLSGKFKDHHR